ncbi:MAG: CPBP family intramembrane metalloprotease [Lachnospiraceae bacterium]|nr:CPBP family intramembrane metalloprotease [Lachnospiraceae bacterium]
MNNFWKSFGWFLMSTLPLVLSLIMQAIVGAIALAIHGIFVTVREQLSNGSEHFDPEAFMDSYIDNVMAGSSTAVFAYHVVATAVFFLWYYLIFIRPNRHVPRSGKVLTLPIIGWSVAVGVTLCVFSTQMVYLGEYLVPEMINDFYEMLENAGFGINALAIIAAIILAPVGEELLCRGVIQHYAMKATKRFWIANVIQALMFGLMHMNMVQGTYAFFIGLVLGWLRLRYKTLWVPIIIHFVVNISTSTWLGYLLEEIPRNFTTDLGLFVLAIAATMGILAVIGKAREEAV